MSMYTENAMLIMRVMRLAQAAVESRFIQDVVPNRLTIVQFKALQHLQWYGGGAGMTIGELGEHLGLAHSTVSGLVDRLERDEWIIRRKCDEDRRRSRIHLTEQCKQLFRERAEQATGFWHQTVGQLTPQEQEALIVSLKRLKAVMEKPVWPSYDQLHPRDPNHLQKRLESELDESAQTKFRSIGLRLTLAKMAEEQKNHELAAYLRQVATEETSQTNQVFCLLGGRRNLKSTLFDLLQQDRVMYDALLELVDVAQAANHDEALSLLQQMVKDNQRYKRWLSDMLKQMNE